jgi:hypothetical protein
MVAMAAAKRSWIEILVLEALCLSVCAAAFAQPNPDHPAPPHFIQIQSPQSGSLSGKLTDLHSAPLGGVAVVLRNQATGAELRATTAKNGGFRFASLVVGEYSLEADEPRIGRGRLDGIVISGGIESRVQAAMHLEPNAPTTLADAPSIQKDLTAQSTSPQPGAIPKQSTPSIQSSLLQQHSVSAVPPMQLAASAPPSSAEPLWNSPPKAPRTANAHAPNLRQLPPAQTPIRAPSHPAIHVQNAAPRAELETESAQLEPLPAIALPLHKLSLPARLEPSMLLTAAAAGSTQTAMLHNLSHLGPIVSASQKPDPAAAAVTTTISAAQLQSLPISGRRWQEFLQDTPAANASADSAQPTFRGASVQPAEITVDGASMRLAFGVAAGSESGSQVPDPSSQGANQKSSIAPAWAGGRGPGVGEAAIREVETTAGNVEAEGMRSASGRTGIRTASGGDSLHGQGFLFDRQNTWGARNPFHAVGAESWYDVSAQLHGRAVHSARPRNGVGAWHGQPHPPRQALLVCRGG